MFSLAVSVHADLGCLFDAHYIASIAFVKEASIKVSRHHRYKVIQERKSSSASAKYAPYL